MIKPTEVYEFTLILEDVNDDTPHLEDQLFNAGCDDTLINFREGSVYLDFSRTANSLDEAITSAVQAVSSISKTKVKSIMKSNLPV